MDSTYSNLLKKYTTQPGSYTGSPGFQFALDQGLNGVNAKLAAGGMNGSGNQLAELTRYGTGLAMQDYGSTLDRLGKMTGQEQAYDLGSTKNANDFALGMGRNANDAQQNEWNYDLGLGQNANTADRNQNDYAVNWMNALTNRGRSQSDAYLGDQSNKLNWSKYYQPYPSPGGKSYG